MKANEQRENPLVSHDIGTSAASSREALEASNLKLIPVSGGDARRVTLKIPDGWPAAKYPDAATDLREKDGCRQAKLYGKWRTISPLPSSCQVCGSAFFYVVDKAIGVTCGAVCRNALTRTRNEGKVGDANPHWKGGVSTDNMRYRRRQAERWPERERARRLTRAAILTGKLVQQPCETCGDPKAQAHHDRYDEPLNVRWLCVEHHRAHHQGHATGRIARAALPGEAA